jgi:hypothetical protein
VASSTLRRALSIFAPGSDVLEAAEHDAEAIEHRPDWVKWNYVSEAEQQAAGLLRGWYEGDSRCPKHGADRACDEYAYYASAQAGPGAPLSLIDAGHNRLEGGKYGGVREQLQATE